VVVLAEMGVKPCLTGQGQEMRLSGLVAELAEELAGLDQLLVVQ
jgi:hypothetical protein